MKKRRRSASWETQISANIAKQGKADDLVFKAARAKKEEGVRAAARHANLASRRVDRITQASPPKALERLGEHIRQSSPAAMRVTMRRRPAPQSLNPSVQLRQLRHARRSAEAPRVTTMHSEPRPPAAYQIPVSPAPTAPLLLRRIEIDLNININGVPENVLPEAAKLDAAPADPDVDPPAAAQLPLP